MDSGQRGVARYRPQAAQILEAMNDQTATWGVLQAGDEGYSKFRSHPSTGQRLRSADSSRTTLPSARTGQAPRRTHSTDLSPVRPKEPLESGRRARADLSVSQVSTLSCSTLLISTDTDIAGVLSVVPVASPTATWGAQNASAYLESLFRSVMTKPWVNQHSASTRKMARIPLS